jgi:hypothetical protein
VHDVQRVHVVLYSTEVLASQRPWGGGAASNSKTLVEHDLMTYNVCALLLACVALCALYIYNVYVLQMHMHP